MYKFKDNADYNNQDLIQFNSEFITLHAGLLQFSTAIITTIQDLIQFNTEFIANYAWYITI